MATNRRIIVERMETRERRIDANARGYACAELFLLFAFALCMILFVFAVNAILPPGW